MLSYLVAQRSQELGIRVALGARPFHVYRLVLGEAFWLVAIGFILGVGAALAMSRVLEGMLCATIRKWLTENGAVAGARLLDAGCGTGRYAIELAHHGYVVQGIDASPELIAEARQSTRRASGHVSFSVGDIRTLSSARYEAVLCRGVLNDVLDDDDRQAVLAAFAGALRPQGVLVLDVREWEATARRKAREPLFTKSLATDRGQLTFTSVTRIDPTDRRLIISERHTLRSGGQERFQDDEADHTGAPSGCRFHPLRHVCVLTVDIECRYYSGHAEAIARRAGRCPDRHGRRAGLESTQPERPPR